MRQEIKNYLYTKLKPDYSKLIIINNQKLKFELSILIIVFF